MDFIHIVSSDPKYAGNLLTNVCRPVAAARMEYDMLLFTSACSSNVFCFQPGVVLYSYAVVIHGMQLQYYFDILYSLEINEYK